MPAADGVELLSPAGSFETALAAFAAGADAVYLGLRSFSARADAVNLSPGELRSLMSFARANGRKVYVTFNTLIDDVQLRDAAATLAQLERIRPDGLIVQDLGVARMARRHFPGLALHASTQMAAHNLEGVLALKEFGFTRVVLARETPLEDIRDIVRRSGIEIEIFVHGALCYSISGLCLFSAMEKERSGNRGRCAYCCRMQCADAGGRRSLPFSMKDLRLDGRLEALKEAGVASLKIEGRMKSALYVASATKRYRDLLDGREPAVTRADLETVFSRRTTELYIDGWPGAGADPRGVIDSDSLGHLGTPVGKVKHVSRDRDGGVWIRFHTGRALERHDGIQFSAPDGGRPSGFGIAAMRSAISRRNVYEVAAGDDVELLLPREVQPPEPGATVFCSASEAVRRRFPAPVFRPADYPPGTPVDVSVTLSPDGLSASAEGFKSIVNVQTALAPAKQPERTFAAVEKAFSRMGERDWALGRLAVNDPCRLFAPASLLNGLRRALADALDAESEELIAASVSAAVDDYSCGVSTADTSYPANTVKIPAGRDTPEGDWDEVILGLERSFNAPCDNLSVRLALPLFTKERDFAAMRAAVKRLVRRGFAKWEAADMAGLRLLRQCGVKDITADWSLYALNRQAALALGEYGISRFVVSPECGAENAAALASADGIPHPEFLAVQSTPLFISVTRPCAEDPSRLMTSGGERYVSYFRDGLWITVREEPRVFTPPRSASRRSDFSWDPRPF